jgi:hypothetical protein
VDRDQTVIRVVFVRLYDFPGPEESLYEFSGIEISGIA